MIATANNSKTLQPSYHRNQQYSIVGLTNAAGTLVERYTYTAYGTLDIYAANGTVRTTSTCANRYTYTGREYDLDLKLYHFRARWYDPATGGFISRDPLGYVDGMSLYRGYFGVRGKDPTGRLLTHDGTLWPKSSSWPPVYVGGYSELLNPKRDQFTCCSDAIEQRLHVRYEGIWPGRREKISLGFVVCCDGVKHSCFTRAGGLSQTAGFEAGLIVNACLLEHEDSHHEHTEECAKSACANLYRPKLRTEFSVNEQWKLTHWRAKRN